VKYYSVKTLERNKDISSVALGCRFFLKNYFYQYFWFIYLFIQALSKDVHGILKG